MRFTIRHTFATDTDTFWNNLFFDEAYNKELFEGHLHFPLYDVLQLDKQDDGTIIRRIEAAPPVEVPAVVRKVIGDSTSYVEEGRFDPRTRTFRVTVKPKVGGDRIKTEITIRAEPRGDKRVERIAEVDNQVKVFGVGKVIEAFIEKQTRDSYDASADFTHRWITERGL